MKDMAGNWVLKEFGLLAMALSSMLCLARPPIPAPSRQTLSNPWFREIRFDRPIRDDEVSIAAVFGLLQDRQGFLWIASQDGLIKYDGYNLRTYRHDANRSDSISDSWVYDIAEDPKGGLWLATYGGGLNYFDPEREQFHSFRHNKKNIKSLSHDELLVLCSDGAEGLWIGHLTGLDHFDIKTGLARRLFEEEGTPKALKEAGGVRCIWRDPSGTLWLGTSKSGLWSYTPNENRYKHWFPESLSLSPQQWTILSLYPNPSGGWWLGTMDGLAHLDNFGALHWYNQDSRETNGLKNDSIYALRVDQSKRLWVGSDDGLHLFLPETKRFDRYVPEDKDTGTFSTHQVRTLYEDRGGILWVGALVGGLARYNPQAPPFLHYRNRPGERVSLTSNYVRAIHQDPEGRLWIGMMGGGLDRIDREANEVVNYRLSSEEKLVAHEPMGNKITAIRQDLEGTFWLSVWDKGLDRFDGNKSFSHFQPDPSQTNSLAGNRIRSIEVGEDGRVWLGTTQGLQVFAPTTVHETGFRTYLPRTGDSSFDIWHILVDPEAGLWLATTEGLYLFDPKSERFLSHYEAASGPGKLSHNRVRSLAKGRDGSLWLATSGGGVNRFDPKTGQFKAYTSADGLANDALYAVVEDLIGNIWLSSNRGLTRLNLSSNPPQIKNFTRDQGLQHHEFNAGAFLRGHYGELFFGGIGGLNAFHPARIRENHQPPAVAITAFQLMGQSTPLVPRLNSNGVLVLRHLENFFGFEFSALDFAQPHANLYRYKLEGFDADWVDLGHRHMASYTNLNPGLYRFQVKAANSDGIWNEVGIDLPIRVLPPYWRSPWAYLLYLVCVLLAVTYYINRQRKKLAEERALVDRLQLIDRLKDEFLANTSHELRTPLNGIIGLTESLLDGSSGSLNEMTRASLQMVSVSGRRLANLVNDLLDFSILKNSQIELRLKPLDLRCLVEVVLTLSRPLVEEKAVRLINEVPADLPPVHADEDRMQQILLNLIGNAIKFTEVGEVTISARLKYDTEGPVLVEVRDTGIGIDPARRDRIWESFEQGDGSISRKYGGAGLGLAITRKLVELLGGSIWVESSPGVGSIFRFTLPIAHGTVSEETPKWLERLSEPILMVKSIRNQGNSFKLLIVDDEPINRMVLQQQLALEPYDIREAGDGEEALALIEAGEIPDLILLDVMMPRVSGYQVCEKLRERFSCHEMPILFLTAKNQMIDLVQGFQLGANDYLGKPVAKNELIARVRMHLQLLDVNRRLEQKVSERTRELLEKNEAILTAQNQLITQEKMATAGILMAGMAHQLKNPLNFIKNFTEMVLELSQELAEELQTGKPALAQELGQVAAMIRDNAQLIHKHSLRAGEILAAMHLFTDKTSKPELVAFNHFVEKYVMLAIEGSEFCHEERHLKVELALDPEVKAVPFSQPSFSRAIISLVRNALDAMLLRFTGNEDGYQPHLRVSSRLLQDQVELIICDNGHGIPQEIMHKVFNPFFTTRPTSSNHIGLGLSISYDVIVKEHGGVLKIASEFNSHTEIHILLPLHQA